MLLLWHGYKNKTGLTLGLGVVVLVLATCGIPMSFFLFRYLRKKRKDRQRAYRVERNNRKMEATYENPTATAEDEKKDQTAADAD